ncbi:hypothetical protein [Pedobacter sp. UC225_65]|uniref:hypothetical protein n=1 Tax=Pedobacter sp. UC225_65 TaxID=3350173 RepID=UPI00366C35DF
MTFEKFKEKYLAIILSLLIGALNYKFQFSKCIDMEKLADKAIDVSSISFGFLLAVLALLLQTQTPKLDRIKSAGKFGELVGLNRRAVISSSIVAIVSLLYVSINLGLTNFQHNINISILFDSFILITAIYLVIVVYQFLDLFYFLIK